MITIKKGSISLTNPIDIPGSKYLANRLLVAASIANGTSFLKNVPENEDIETAIEGLKQFGVQIKNNNHILEIKGINTKPLIPKKAIYTKGNGTFSRFVVTLACLCKDKVVIKGNEKMSTRPMQSIFEAIRLLGGKVESTGNCLPATVLGPLLGGNCFINGSISSQYISSLILSGGFAKKPITITLQNKVISKKYIDMTIQITKMFGGKIRNESYQKITIKPIEKYQAQQLTLEPDPVSASYFLALGAILGKKVTIRGYNIHSYQGEAKFPTLLEKMGCQWNLSKEDLFVNRDPRIPLKGIEVDMGDMPDVVQTLMVCAVFAKGKTLIKNIGHLKYKESNRIEETAEEFLKLGIKVKYNADSMLIEGGFFYSGVINPRNDHRTAMSLSLLALGCDNIKIENETCINKSFPNYWKKLSSLGFIIDEN